jgi:hypothetical protein
MFQRALLALFSLVLVLPQAPAAPPADAVYEIVVTGMT